MSSFNEMSKTDINQKVTLHDSEIKLLKKEFPASLASYKKSVEALKKAYDKYNRAAKKYERHHSEKNEILFAGADRSLVRSVISTDEYAKKVNGILDNIDNQYSQIIDLIIETSPTLATKYAASRRSFMEKAAMDMDEAYQIIADYPMPSVDKDSGKIISFTDPSHKADGKNDKSWAAHELNAELNRCKESLRAAMAFYKRAIKDLERAALDFTKAKKKYSKSNTAKSAVILDGYRNKYLEAVSVHNGAAESINREANFVFECYDNLKSALTANRRALIKVASEQDAYYEKLTSEIKKLRAPIVALGIKTVN